MSPRSLAFILVHVFLSATSLLAQGPPPAGPQASIQKGVRLFQEKKYAQARHELRRATERLPSSAPGFFYLGMAEWRLGDAPAAERGLRRSLKLQPRAVNTLYNLGVLLLDQKNPAEAAPFLERANRIGPPTPELAVNLIRAYLESGQSDAAKAKAESVGRRFERSPGYHLAVGKLFLDRGLAAPARVALEQANRLAPAQPEIVLPLADACLEQHDAARALGLLRGVGDASEAIADYHFLLGRAYFYLRQKDPALSEMQQAIRLDSRNPLYRVTLARFYQKYGDQRSALDTLQQAERLDPNLPEIPYSIAVTYFITDEYDLAVKYLERAIELDPGFDRAIFLLGSVRAIRGRFEEAEALLTRAMRAKPQNPFYVCTHGMVLLSQNKLPEALWNFRRTLEIFPTYALAHYQVGRVLAREGKQDEARAALEKAIALQPDLPEAWYQLGQTYRRLGMKQKADDALAKFREFRSGEYSERQEVLRQVQQVVQGEP